MGKIKLPKNIKHISSMFMISIMTVLVLASTSEALTIRWYSPDLFIGSDGNWYYCISPGAHQCAVGTHVYQQYEVTSSTKKIGSPTVKNIVLSKSGEENIQSTSFGTNEILVGPYKIKSNVTESSISTIKVKAKAGTTPVEYNENAKIVDSTGKRITNLEMTKNKEFVFYLKLPATVTEVNSVKITVKTQKARTQKVKTTTVRKYKCIGVSGSHQDGQNNWIAVSPSGTQKMKKTTTKTKNKKEAISKSITFGEVELSGSLIIQKTGNAGVPLSGVHFKVTNAEGYNETFVTDATGKIQIDNLEVGTYTVQETQIDNDGYGQANYGYILNTTPKSAVVNSTAPVTVSFVNDYQLGSLYITKKDTVSNGPLANVEFTVQMSSGNMAGQYVGVNAAGDAVYSPTAQILRTSASGEIRINKVWPGDFRLVEVKNPNAKYETIPPGGKVILERGTVVKGQQFSVDVKNKYVYGKIKIVKYIENTTIGLPNVEFTLYNENKTTEIAKYVTGADGTVTSGSLLMGTYWLKETKAPDKYQPLSDWIRVDLTEDERYSIHTVTVSNRQSKIDLSGFVWEDGNSGKDSLRNGLFHQDANDNKDSLLNGITVRLMRNGAVVKQTKTDKLNRYTTDGNDGNGEYLFKDVDIYEGGTNILNQYYIEFEYDGITYTNVLPNLNNSKGSKAGENTQTRTNFNNKFSIIDGSGVNPTTDTGLVSIGTDGQKHNLSYTRDKANYKSTINYTEELKMTSNTSIAGYNIGANHSIGVLEIRNINFGIERREQPDLATIKDLENVRLSVNGYTHIYGYNQKAKKQDGENGFNKGFNVGVKFENRYDESYRRAIYEADINYVDDNNKTNELKVNMVYKIEIANASTSLVSQVQKIVDYYDSRYTLVKAGTKISEGLITDSIGYQEISGYDTNGYSKAIIDTNMQIEPQAVQTIYLEFSLNREAVLQIMNGNKTLNNVAEILTYSTLKDGKLYAGIDKNSIPGNAIPEDKTTYEDDTDKAPSLILEIADARKVKGIVFEDATGELKTGSIRQGDGVYNSSQDVPVGDVQVEMKSTRPDGANKTYKTKTVNSDGWYTFTSQVDGNVITTLPTQASQDDEGALQLNKGDYYIDNYLPDEYVVTFVWGDNTYTVQQFKGTTYDLIRYNDNTQNKQWYKTEIDNRYTDAIDDYTLRENIDAQTNVRPTISETRIMKMNSATPTMLAHIEYDTTYTESEGDRYEYVIKNIDFGIVERARQFINIHKNVDTVQIVLANGNMIVNAKVNQETGKLEGDVDESTVYLPPIPGVHSGMIKSELASELIQGAKITINYKIMVENLSEVDYNDKNYYIHGIVPQDGANIIKLKPEGVYDYLEKSLSQADTSTTNGWNTVSFEEYNNQVGELTETEFRNKVCEYYASVENIPDVGTVKRTEAMTAENYYYSSNQEILEEWKQEVRGTRKEDFANRIILFNEKLTKELEPGERNEVSLEASKMLSTSEEIALDNTVEITKITKNGGAIPDVIRKEYVGQLIDEAETVIVTPSTGANKDYTTPILLTISLLVILSTGVILIKKKVLNK